METQLASLKPSVALSSCLVATACVKRLLNRFAAQCATGEVWQSARWMGDRWFDSRLQNLGVFVLLRQYLKNKLKKSHDVKPTEVCRQIDKQIHSLLALTQREGPSHLQTGAFVFANLRRALDRMFETMWWQLIGLHFHPPDTIRKSGHCISWGWSKQTRLMHMQQIDCQAHIRLMSHCLWPPFFVQHCACVCVCVSCCD